MYPYTLVHNEFLLTSPTVSTMTCWMVCAMRSRWPYSVCFWGAASSCLVKFLSAFFFYCDCMCMYERVSICMSVYRSVYV